MPAHELPQPRTYLPITFLERGVLVPFTTPMLVGTRARPNERSGPELLVPNLSGGPGVYVVPWRELSAFCPPTVHDRRLNQQVERLRSVTPGTIRQVARAAALEGLAGREAQTAAAKADESDRHARRRTNFLLLAGLLGRLEPAAMGASRVSEPSAEFEAHAFQAIAERAARLGLPADTITTDLEQLAEVFTSVGMQGEGGTARLPALLAMLARLREETAAWAREHRSAGGELAAMVAEVAAATIGCAASTLREARALTQDVTDLVQQWTTSPGRVIRIVARPEWLLDGWEQICLLWRDAVTPGARDAALAEMAMLMPVLPKETWEWTRLPAQDSGVYTYRRTVLAQEEWRTGAHCNDLVPRNERLRAQSV